MSAPLRLECAQCERLAPAAGFRVEGGRLYLTCSRCGAEGLALEAADAVGALPEGVHVAVLPRSAPPAPVAPSAPAVPLLRLVEGEGGEVVAPEAQEALSEEALFSAPPGTCPKCVGPRPEGALSCRACGLVFANFQPEAQRPPAPMAAAWVRLVGRWAEPAAHLAFLSQAQSAGQLAAAGRLYRLYLAHRPEDGPARRGVEEVVRRALLPSEGRPADGGALPRKALHARWVVALLLCALAVGLGALFLRAVLPHSLP